MDIPGVDAVAGAVADPVRREILERLRAGPLSAGELGAGFGVSRPAVSRHLRVLREAGLVVDEPVGRRRLYSLRPDGLLELRDWLARFAGDGGWAARMSALETEVRRTGRDRRRAGADEEGKSA